MCGQRTKLQRDSFRASFPCAEFGASLPLRAASSLGDAMKVLTIYPLALFSSVAMAISFVPNAAQAFASCNDIKKAIRDSERRGDYQSAQTIRSNMGYTCSGQLARDLRAIKNGTYQDPNAGSDAAAAFIGGVIEGYLGGSGGGGRTYQRSGPSRVSVRQTNNLAPVHIQRPISSPIPSISRSVTPVPTVASKIPSSSNSPSTLSQKSQTTSPPQSSASAGTPAGYITINGKPIPYYSKPPCATTKQVGPTSYICTNN